MSETQQAAGSVASSRISHGLGGTIASLLQVHKLMRRALYLQGEEPADIERRCSRDAGYAGILHDVLKHYGCTVGNLLEAGPGDLVPVLCGLREKIHSYHDSKRAKHNEWYPDGWREAL